METVTKEETQADFEVHRKYMDIQIDLEGIEEIQIGGTTEGEKFPYSEEMDFGTVLCEKKAACLLGQGRFIPVSYTHLFWEGTGSFIPVRMDRRDTVSIRGMCI